MASSFTRRTVKALTEVFDHVDFCLLWLIGANALQSQESRE